MAIIHLYLDKNNNSNNKIIDILKKHSIDFLQFNIKNTKENIKLYDLESVPALKFKDLVISDINENSINSIVNEFNNFISSLPTIPQNKF